MRFRADETKCRSCHEIYPGSDLDRYLWCPRCRKQVRRRGVFWGRVVGFIASLGVAAYLFIRVDPSGRFLAFYLLLLGLTYVLISRITVALIQGFCRAKGSAPGVSSEDPPPGGPERASSSV